MSFVVFVHVCGSVTGLYGVFVHSDRFLKFTKYVCVYIFIF